MGEGAGGARESLKCRERGVVGTLTYSCPELRLNFENSKRPFQNLYQIELL